MRPDVDHLIDHGLDAMSRHPLARRLVLRFLRREDGTITTFALLIFILMVAVAGIAIDIMRYETQRVQLQYTLDRAVLAAASIGQPRNPVEVVENYFEISGLENYRLNVDVEDALNFRRVEAYAELEVPTLFMHMFGVRMLTSPAEGAAEEQIPNVEVSLVLDVSGSMRFTDSDGMPQINRLRPAARNFVSRMLEGDRDQLTTISIVPYAGQVNPGGQVYDLMGGVRTYVDWVENGATVTALRDHPNSTCPELQANDFTLSAIPQGGTYGQIPHFMNWRIDNPTMNWGWCPLEGDVDALEASSSIQYFSADEDRMHGFIDRMRLHDGTGTHVGMLWGLWLLDPNSGWLVDELVATGVVNSGFEDRPAAFDDPETIKVVVLMTDGNITDQFRPRFADRTEPPINATTQPNIFLNHTEELHDMSNSSQCNSNGCRVTHTNRATNLSRFYAACNRAKDNGVVIFTIAFNANSNARTEMETCASSLSHYYNVRGADLDAAFQSIAGAIQMLRLVQ